MEIECEFEDAVWDLISPESAYTCTVTSCNITERGFEVAEFVGDHDDGKNNGSVKGLCFEYTKVHYMPKKLAEIFPDLVYLTIRNCELKEVSANDLIGLEKLEDLSLEGNNITTLPVDLFKNMKNLKLVIFSDNLIQKFDAKILEPIKDTIDFFEIQNNPGIDKVFNKKRGDIDDFIERLDSKKKDSQRLEHMFTGEKHSDFIIKVKNKEYRVHKVILATLSSVFDKMFSDDATATLFWKTFDNTRNFSEGAIEEFLQFFYTRTLRSDENAADLLDLAIEFEIPDLKRKCEAVLVQKIDAQSARQLYNLAVHKSLPKLKQKAFDVIQERHPEIEDYIYDQPDLVNRLIDAKDQFQAKKIKLDKEE